MKLKSRNNNSLKFRKITFFLLLLLLPFVTSCNKPDAPDCFQTSGKMIQKEIQLENFDELIVYKGINVFIEQSPEYKIVIESGENLITDIHAEVENHRLSLRNENTCNLFRDYDVTSIYVSVPNLTWLQNAGNKRIESIGLLDFPNIWLRSYNQVEDLDIYTVGDFQLKLHSDKIRITSDNFSNFFLSGETRKLDLFFANGDGRLEAANLMAETIDVMHRGSNKLIVNPQHVLKGEIRSTGDIISVNRPPRVDVKQFYTGKLLFR